MIKIRLVKAENLRRTLVLLFYAAYIAALLFFASDSEITSDMTLFALLIMFVPFGLFYEFIRFYFYKANYSLNTQCDVELVEKYLKPIERCNILNEYSLLIAYLKGFILVDNNMPKKALDLIQHDYKRVRESEKNLDFHYNYLLFLCYIAINDKKNIKKYYINLNSIMKINKRSGSEIASLANLIHGIYYLFCKDYDKAANSFNNINIEKISRHERAKYYFYLAHLNAKQLKQNEMEKNYNKAIELAPGIKLITENKPTIS